MPRHLHQISSSNSSSRRRSREIPVSLKQQRPSPGQLQSFAGTNHLLFELKWKGAATHSPPTSNPWIRSRQRHQYWPSRTVGESQSRSWWTRMMSASNRPWLPACSVEHYLTFAASCDILKIDNYVYQVTASIYVCRAAAVVGALAWAPLTNPSTSYPKESLRNLARQWETTRRELRT